MFYTIHLNSFSALAELFSGIEQCGHFLYNLFSLWPRTEEEQEEALVLAPVVSNEGELGLKQHWNRQSSAYTNESRMKPNMDHIVHPKTSGCSTTLDSDNFTMASCWEKAIFDRFTVAVHDARSQVYNGVCVCLPAAAVVKTSVGEHFDLD